jgi:hypothetical protein
MNHDNRPPTPETHHNTATPLVGLTFDPDDYRHHLSDYELTKEQEDEFLRSLSIIIQIFVDMGFGSDPLQLVFPEMDPGGDDEDKT